MDKSTKQQRSPKLVQAVEALDRLEHDTRFDAPIARLARAVRHKIGPGRLRDTLHGVPFGHPVHPPLASFAVGCFAATAVLDLTGAGSRAAGTVLAAGIAGSLPAAAAGIVDWSVLHREQQRVGFVHAIANVASLGLFSTSLALRLAGRHGAGRALAFAGLGVSTAAAYLGGHMAFRQAAGANHADSVAHLTPTGWHDLCELTDLPNGRAVTRRLGYINLFVLRRGDSVTAVSDSCSHLAGPLHQGRMIEVDGEMCVMCPWHGSTFRLADGAVIHGPATARQPAFHTRLRRDGMVQVRAIG